ncbi:hypothetical protein J7E83_12835 [Arthrobacter sp. ISL-48]|uniref:hypothetical protein n=1 Tax=Arthrobacter sp. ISL-48 TaxID=2819110 RepID=UPI001BE9EC0C|nr:hypothetical protein [Arthrobacter sp. ISL-48]MBT2532989.1 hypothetical protein [Arthrobacter sp. ISL-48]
MKRRGIILLVLAVLAATLLALTLLLGRMTGVPTVCPAIGYGYTGKVELAFSTEPQSVGACFGDECTATPVAKDADGRWLVPQSSPYLTQPVSVTSVYVEVVTASGASIARVLPIETESTGEHPFGPGCGGPFRFKPVLVPLG